MACLRLARTDQLVNITVDWVKLCCMVDVDFGGQQSWCLGVVILRCPLVWSLQPHYLRYALDSESEAACIT